MKLAQWRSEALPPLKNDEENLIKLGYKQQLLRNLGLLHNFGISFSVIGAITGITSQFQYGLKTGGPATMTIGWLVVSVFSCFIALSMAEIVSATPISGGPYFWAALLAPPKYSAFASWLTAWFNLLGQVALTSAVAFGLAEFIAAMATVKTDFVITPGKTMALFIAILISWGVVNSVGRRFLRHLLYISLALNSLGTVSIAVAVLAKAPAHMTASFVFTNFVDQTGSDDSDGWSVRASPAYVACIGCLLAQYTFTGYDASAHLSEETRRASWNAPLGMVGAVFASVIIGFFLLVALLFSIPDINIGINPAHNQPAIDIFVSIFGINGGLVLSFVIICCQWNSGLFVLTSNSRMIWAFSRDNGLPRFFSKVNDIFICPIRAVWLGTFLSLVLALPSLGSSVAFGAVTSIGTIGILLSYAMPIFIKILCHDSFLCKKGPFYLGAISRPISIAACAWIAFVCIILSLPTSNPVTSETLNYAPVCVGIVILGAGGSWVPMKSRFVGPRKEAIILNRDVDLAPG